MDINTVAHTCSTAIKTTEENEVGKSLGGVDINTVAHTCSTAIKTTEENEVGKSLGGVDINTVAHTHVQLPLKPLRRMK